MANLIGVIFKKNKAREGGAINVSRRATLILKYCKFVKNTALLNGNSIYTANRVISDGNVFNGEENWTKDDIAFKRKY